MEAEEDRKRQRQKSVSPLHCVVACLQLHVAVRKHMEALNPGGEQSKPLLCERVVPSFCGLRGLKPGARSPYIAYIRDQMTHPR